MALLGQETRNYVGKKLLELTLMELFVFRFMQAISLFICNLFLIFRSSDYTNPWGREYTFVHVFGLVYDVNLRVVVPVFQTPPQNCVTDGTILFRHPFPPKKESDKKVNCSRICWLYHECPSGVGFMISRLLASLIVIMSSFFRRAYT